MADNPFSGFATGLQQGFDIKAKKAEVAASQKAAALAQAKQAFTQAQDKTKQGFEMLKEVKTAEAKKFVWNNMIFPGLKVMSPTVQWGAIDIMDDPTSNAIEEIAELNKIGGLKAVSQSAPGILAKVAQATGGDLDAQKAIMGALDLHKQQPKEFNVGDKTISANVGPFGEISPIPGAEAPNPAIMQANTAEKRRMDELNPATPANQASATNAAANAAQVGISERRVYLDQFQTNVNAFRQYAQENAKGKTLIGEGVDAVMSWINRPTQDAKLNEAMGGLVALFQHNIETGKMEKNVDLLKGYQGLLDEVRGNQKVKDPFVEKDRVGKTVPGKEPKGGLKDPNWKPVSGVPSKVITALTAQFPDAQEGTTKRLKGTNEKFQFTNGKWVKLGGK